MNIETTVNRQVLKAAVQRAIFCPFTGKCLDTRKAVLVTKNGQGSAIMDGAFYDAEGKAKLDEAFGAGTYEVIDGRKLGR
jgi:hypothetical protein